MRELKPGEYMGEDGLVHRAHLHHSVEHGDGRWWPAQSRVLPSSPDFPAAVEALQKLIPEPFEWKPENGCLRRYHNGRVEWRSSNGSWMRPSVGDVELSCFEAGRRYERERGQ